MRTRGGGHRQGAARMKYWLAALAVIAIAVAIVYPHMRPKPQTVGYCGDCHEMGDSSAAWLARRIAI